VPGLRRISRVLSAGHVVVAAAVEPGIAAPAASFAVGTSATAVAER